MRRFRSRSTQTHCTARKWSTAILPLGIAGLLLGPPALADVGDGPAPSAIEQAQSSVDHAAIAEAYREQATAMREKVEKHQAMLDSYEKQRGYLKEKNDIVGHCKSLISHFDGAAEAADALAADHQRLAAESQIK